MEPLSDIYWNASAFALIVFSVVSYVETVSSRNVAYESTIFLYSSNDVDIVLNLALIVSPASDCHVEERLFISFLIFSNERFIELFNVLIVEAVLLP